MIWYLKLLQCSIWVREEKRRWRRIRPNNLIEGSIKILWWPSSNVKLKGKSFKLREINLMIWSAQDSSRYTNQSTLSAKSYTTWWWIILEAPSMNLLMATIQDSIRRVHLWGLIQGICQRRIRSRLRVKRRIFCKMGRLPRKSCKTLLVPNSKWTIQL